LSSVVHFIVCSVGPGVGKPWPVGHIQLVDTFKPVQGGFLNLYSRRPMNSILCCRIMLTLIIMNCI